MKTASASPGVPGQISIAASFEQGTLLNTKSCEHKDLTNAVMYFLAMYLSMP